MLSSRWTGAKIYKCHSLAAGNMYILATSLDNAKAAYEVSTKVPPERSSLFIEFGGDVAITEEAQAQSVIFPNGIK